MTAQTVSVHFPSIDFLLALKDRMNANEAKYRAMGTMDLHLGITIEADASLKDTQRYALLFDGYECLQVETLAEGDEPDLDLTIAGPYGGWKEMFEIICKLGHADTTHTLNHLVMLEDPLRTEGADQYRVDKLYRFAFTVQSFVEEAAGLNVTFAS